MRTWIAVGGVACLIVSIVWVTLVHVARLHTWRAALCGTGLACLVGSAIGSAMVYVAMDHNPQEEFVSHATGAINYAGLAEIFVSWFAVVSVVASAAFALVVWVVRGLRSLYQLVTR